MNKKEWEEIVKDVKEFNITFGNERYYLKGAFTQERELVRLNWFIEEFEEYDRALSENNKVEMLDAICDMYYIYIGTLLEKYEGDVKKVVDKIFFNEFGHSELKYLSSISKEFRDVFIEAFMEVHRSNMSKLDENGLPIYREDGKIMKGKNYFKPNLKQFIGEE